MRFTRRAAQAGVAAALALAGMGAVAAQPASAAEGCRPHGLCLYHSTGFVDMRFVTERSGGYCWLLEDFGLDYNVHSYRNNLPVTVEMYDGNGNFAWSIRPGGSSSDSTPFTGEYKVCT